MTGPFLNGFGKTLAGSVIFHAALLAAALLYAGANKVFITPVYTVDLVTGDPGRAVQQARPAPEPVEEPAQRPAPPAEHKAEAVQVSKDALKVKEKPSVEDALKTIQKKVEKRKDEALVASSIDDLRKKMEASRQSRDKVAQLKEELASRSSAPRAEAAKPAPAPPKNPATGGRASLEAKYPAYYGVIKDKVQENWIYPQGLKDNKISVIVSIKIERSGKLVEAAVEKSSGNKAFDDSLLKAIKKSAPFPPLPVDLEGSFLETGLRFCPGCAQ